jgi:putative ABC transport system permease protein
MIGTILWMAIREVLRNRMRSALTTLGIVIGVGAVIAMVTLGEGASAQVRQNVAAMGENLLIVSPGFSRGRGPAAASSAPFEIEDAQAIERELSTVSAVAPTASRGLLVIAGNKNRTTQVTGVTSDFFGVRRLEVESGRSFTYAEEQGQAACILGATTRKELFGNQDPVGTTLRVGKLPCEVIGVLASKGANTFGADQDDLVLLPLRTFQRRIAGNNDVNTIFVTATSDRATARAKAQIESLFRQRRRIAPGTDADFRIHDTQEMAETMESVTRTLTALLGAIAAVSLLVGGIGIMNIMLVSVTERTREIGLRMAIGARAREVLLQFLVESVVLSVLGGAIGTALGLAGSALACRALDMPFVIVPWIVAVAFVFSAAVGVAFGYLPARKAARLDPIEALRHE